MERRALIDERIKTLLTTTDLTFKQIIETLKSENMSASFNTIRRVNRNHVYRKPRYDAKLTPDQRKELIITLINTTKPNLSSLARQFGVCHGSIWYWWDKLTKIKEKNNGIIPGNELPSEFDQNFNYEPTSTSINNSEREEENVCDDYDDMTEVDQQEDNGLISDPYSDPLDLDYEEDRHSGVNEVNRSIKSESTDSELNEEPISIKNLGEVEIVGRVQAKDLNGEYIKLPIIMYAPVPNASQGWQNFSLISGGDSSSTNSTPSTSTGLSGSLNKNQNLNFGY